MQPRSLSSLQRWWIIAPILALVVIQLILFNPQDLSPLASGEEFALDRSVLTEDLKTGFDLILAELPDEAPSYTAQGSRWVSTLGDRVRWKIESERAAKFREETRLFSSRVRIQLYDQVTLKPSTLVLARESIFAPELARLDLYGDVRIQLADGFLIESDFAHYFTDLELLVIPPPWPAQGTGETADHKTLQFQAVGVQYDTKADRLELFSESLVTYDTTKIESDHAVMERRNKTGFFDPFSFRPPARRFVHIRKPDLYVRSRVATLMYEAKAIRVLHANDDVYMEDRSHPESVRYATCGHAEFDREFDQVTLTKYPQIYQDRDTVVGDRILIRRKQNVVEVERSNAFTE